ncbi:hypothetical protein KSP39_PZI022522 [Platanthera zijinensis]|uniref:Uncharacterized protein n=1 Tax=Platanthera zijinensis TaxID=2320716 RepID=A0AAP0AW76_9ASPA
MVSGFRRSLSLSVSGAHRSNSGHKTHPPPEKSYHIRSVSLPCRSHPLISQIEDELSALRSFQIRPEIEKPTLDWVSSGLRRLESLHSVLDDLLHLPQANAVLRHRPAWADRALEDFLLFADVYDTFRSAAIAVKHHAALAEVAVRRRDDSDLISCLREQKKTEKKLIRLSAVLRDGARPAPGATGLGLAAEAEIAGVIRDVTSVTMMATTALFSAVRAVFSNVFSAMAAPSTAKWVVRPLRRVSGKKWTAAAEEEKLGSLEDLEGRVGVLEADCERVFRCFVNTRVTLLNSLSPFSS